MTMGKKTYLKSMVVFGHAKLLFNEHTNHKWYLIMGEAREWVNYMFYSKSKIWFQLSQSFHLNMTCWLVLGDWLKFGCLVRHDEGICYRIFELAIKSHVIKTVFLLILINYFFFLDHFQVATNDLVQSAYCILLNVGLLQAKIQTQLNTLTFIAKHTHIHNA